MKHDNYVALHLAYKPTFHKQTKYINLSLHKYLFIREVAYAPSGGRFIHFPCFSSTYCLQGPFIKWKS